MVYSVSKVYDVSWCDCSDRCAAVLTHICQWHPHSLGNGKTASVVRKLTSVQTLSVQMTYLSELLSLCKSYQFFWWM